MLQRTTVDDFKLADATLRTLDLPSVQSILQEQSASRHTRRGTVDLLVSRNVLPVRWRFGFLSGLAFAGGSRLVIAVQRYS